MFLHHPASSSSLLSLEEQDLSSVFSSRFIHCAYVCAIRKPDRDFNLHKPSTNQNITEQSQNLGPLGDWKCEEELLSSRCAFCSLYGGVMLVRRHYCKLKFSLEWSNRGRSGIDSRKNISKRFPHLGEMVKYKQHLKWNKDNVKVQAAMVLQCVEFIQIFSLGSCITSEWQLPTKQFLNKLHWLPRANCWIVLDVKRVALSGQICALSEGASSCSLDTLTHNAIGKWCLSLSTMDVTTQLSVVWTVVCC